MVRCPNCNRQMKEVSARANPGQLIILDQCGQCGGVWCDKWELFPLDFDDAEKIDALDQDRLKDLTPLTKKSLYCPRCTAALQFVAEPMLPKDIQLCRCLRCDGIWLNRGQLRRYKEYQQQTRVTKLGKSANAPKLPAAEQRLNSWIVTGTGGMFAYPQSEPESDDVVEKKRKRRPQGHSTKLAATDPRYLVADHNVATNSISTSAPRGNPATATVERAGFD